MTEVIQLSKQKLKKEDGCFVLIISPVIWPVVGRCARTGRPDVMSIRLFDDHHRVAFGCSGALLIVAGRNRPVRIVRRCIVVIITFGLSKKIINLIRWRATFTFFVYFTDKKIFIFSFFFTLMFCWRATRVLDPST